MKTVLVESRTLSKMSAKEDVKRGKNEETTKTKE
jgi:hypothetical protein